jgi:hypothetical protein
MSMHALADFFEAASRPGSIKAIVSAWFSVILVAVGVGMWRGTEGYCSTGCRVTVILHA